MTPRVIVLEGPDGAGKSRLSETLHNWYVDRGLTVDHVHHGPYPGETAIWHHYSASMLGRDPYGGTAAIDDRRDVVILDRCWISDIPYGQEFRNGRRRISDHEQRVLEYILRGHNGAVILCLPPFVNCWATFTARRQDEWKQLGVVDCGRAPAVVERERLHRIWNWYAVSAPRDFLYDYTVTPAARVAQFLKETE